MVVCSDSPDSAARRDNSRAGTLLCRSQAVVRVLLHSAAANTNSHVCVCATRSEARLSVCSPAPVLLNEPMQLRAAFIVAAHAASVLLRGMVAQLSIREDSAQRACGDAPAPSVGGRADMCWRRGAWHTGGCDATG